jgi:hypothetical protein
VDKIKRRLLVALVVVALLPLLLVAQVRYFPKGAFGRNPSEAKFIAKWYSSQLTALQEPSLFEMARVSSNGSYRFLWLRSFHHPVAIRVDIKADGTGILTTKVANGTGGFHPGVLTMNTSTPLTQEQTRVFLAEIGNEAFWSIPSMNDRDSGVDGAQWVVEGVHAGKYHAVDRWSPKTGAIRELGLLFLKDLAHMKIPDRELY